MSDSVPPHRQQPTRLHRPWDSPGKNIGVCCHFLLQCMKGKMKSLNRVQLLATRWTAAYQAPLSMGFSRQEYWSGMPLPSPKNFPRQALKLSRLVPIFILQAFSSLEHPSIVFLTFSIHIKLSFPYFYFLRSLSANLINSIKLRF